jgi:hypothetical protein
MIDYFLTQIFLPLNDLQKGLTLMKGIVRLIIYSPKECVYS